MVAIFSRKGIGNCPECSLLISLFLGWLPMICTYQPLWPAVEEVVKDFSAVAPTCQRAAAIEGGFERYNQATRVIPLCILNCSGYHRLGALARNLGELVEKWEAHWGSQASRELHARIVATFFATS
jgi:hypothetical protein